MGSCCDKFRSKDDETVVEEVNERTHLLVDPVSSSATLPRAYGGDYTNENLQFGPKTADEQTALSSVVNEAIATIIDVGALGNQPVEIHDIVSRSKKYEEVIEKHGVKIPKEKPCLLKDISNPERALTRSPIASGDRELMADFLNKAIEALNDIKIEHKEELVVPFIS